MRININITKKGSTKLYFKVAGLKSQKLYIVFKWYRISNILRTHEGVLLPNKDNLYFDLCVAYIEYFNNYVNLE